MPKNTKKTAKKSESVKKKITATKSTKKAEKVTKKIATKTPKKIEKKAAKEAQKKTEKVAKEVKKTEKKPVKKPAKPEKKATKKPTKEVKKATKKPAKTEKKAAKKSESVKNNSNLVKQILAKSAEKKDHPEPKIEVLQKIIFSKKSESKNKVSFKVGDFAVYPSHGIGKIVEIEQISIRDQDFSCYLMYFEREKLTVKIPVNSVDKIGLRHLVNKSQMDEVFVTLRSGVKKLKGMWSRRAQEYETKINSGDIMLLAEVLRDLTRDIEDGERSYSERIIYETAIIRLASEYAAIYGVPFEEAKDKVVLTAKDKINSEGRIVQHDDFDDIDNFKDSESDDENEEDEDDEEEEEDEDDDYFDDDEDDAPKKKKRK